MPPPLDQEHELPGPLHHIDPQDAGGDNSCRLDEYLSEDNDEDIEWDNENECDGNSDYYEDDDDGLYLDLYDDFSIGTKAPQSRSWPSARSRTATTSYPSHLKRSRPQSKSILIPPELLHLIFSQVDRATLCNISKTSRQFNAISKNYIEIVGTWTLGTQEEEDSLIEKMRSGSVNVLKIQYLQSSSRTTGRVQPFDTCDGAWKRFIDCVTEPMHSNKGPSSEASTSGNVHLVNSAMSICLHKQDQKSPCLLDHVKKLIIDDPAFPAILPYLHRIHTLEIHDQGWKGYHDIHLQPLLMTCSNLDTLIVHGHDYQKLYICWNEEATTKVAEETCSTHFRLTRFLTSGGATMSVDTIQEFLGSCPHLAHFSARDIHIRGEGTNSNSPLLRSYVYSHPMAPFYRQAARFCHKLQTFSIAPICANHSDTLAHHLALTAELFPQMPHVDVHMSLPCDWSPDPKTAQFLAQLTSINFGNSLHDMDRLLRHCRMLTRVNARNGLYQRPDRYSILPIRLISWRCPQLRTLDLRVNSLATVKEDEDLFRFLVHACPNLVELTLGLGSLRVGQEELVVSTVRKSRIVTKTITRHHKPPSTYSLNVVDEVKSEEWQEHRNIFCILGRFTRLQRLDVRVDKVPGVLYLSNFAFLRAGNGRNRDEMTKETAFCPRLKSLRIHNWKPVSFGKTREEPLSEQQFVNALKAMRPEVAFAFQ